MPKQVMRRNATDNAYLHKDFHGALSVGIEYLEKRYGPEAVREYLRQFALAFYAPLKEDVRRRGFAAVREHFERIYRMEGGAIRFIESENELRIEVEACPAVQHMRGAGYPVARLFSETTRTVNEAICEGTPLAAELVQYEEQTGRSVQRFFRRNS